VLGLGWCDDVLEDGDGTVSSKAWSRSCEIKEDDLRRMYTSLAEVHFIVLGWREIKVASFGDDQFSFGAAAPPREAMAEVISAWRAGKRRLGG
jgi:hypothetical protein